jgi:hypothetical protein
MRTPTTLVLVGLLAAATTAEGQDDTTRFRWSFALGPSAAVPSGREIRIKPGGGKLCYGCKYNDQLVTGATNGKYHMSVSTSNDLFRHYVALRMEGMFNRSTTEDQMLPPLKCVKGKCTQQRKATRDDSFLLGAGVEGISPEWRRISGYVLVTAGVAVNKLGFPIDTLGNRDRAIGFGPYIAPGIGVKYQVRRKTALYAQWRRAQTFFVPGSSAMPLSFGLLYSASLPNYGY